MSEPLLYEEKQFLGNNRVSIMIRMSLTLFCFIGYYWSENPKPVEYKIFRIGSYPIENIPNSGQIFFVLGVLLILVSAFLVNVLHIQTRVYPNHIILDGFWTARKVKIDLRNIHTVKKMRYKPNSLRRPVYNLHIKGIIKFYTSGNEFVELKDKDGLVYRIGSQRAGELFKIVNQEVGRIIHQDLIS
jgi:hypothetical protein